MYPVCFFFPCNFQKVSLKGEDTPFIAPSQFYYPKSDVMAGAAAAILGQDNSTLTE